MTIDQLDTEALTSLFARVLEDPGVNASSNFFARGGDSLLATRVISRLVRDYGTDLTFAEFTQAPTPRGLAALLRTLPREDCHPDA